MWENCYFEGKFGPRDHQTRYPNLGNAGSKDRAPRLARLRVPIFQGSKVGLRWFHLGLNEQMRKFELCKKSEDHIVMSLVDINEFIVFSISQVLECVVANRNSVDVGILHIALLHLVIMCLH